MNEIFTLATHPVNLPYTALLCLILVYWVTVILGVLDFDFLDVEVEAEVDMDIDIDADTDVQVGVGGFAGFLTFLHIGKVPFMLFMSILAISLWVTAMIISALILPAGGVYFLTWLLPILITGLAMTKILTYPFKRVHSKLNQLATRSRDLIGKTCTIVTGAGPSGYGQAEITHDSQHFLLTVFADGDHNLQKGTPSLIIGYDSEKEAYEVSSL